MDIFYIVIIALWSYPIFAVLASRTAVKTTFLLTSLGLATIILIAMLTGLSTTSVEVDTFLISTLYFSWLMILLFIYALKNIFVKVLSGFFLLSTLLIGYLSGSIGLLGVGLILNDFTVYRTIHLTNNLVYKQYSLGSAPGDYRGIEISIVKRFAWLPGLEYEIFNKKYDRVYNYQKKDGPIDNSYVALFGDDFAVQYNASSKTIILMDSIKKDTINLNRPEN